MDGASARGSVAYVFLVLGTAIGLPAASNATTVGALCETWQEVDSVLKNSGGTASCEASASELFQDSLLLGSSKAQASSLKGTMKAYTSASGNPGSAFMMATSVSRIETTYVINEEWQGTLSHSIGIVGENGPKFLFGYDLQEILGSASGQFSAHMRLSGFGPGLEPYSAEELWVYRYIEGAWLGGDSGSGLGEADLDFGPATIRGSLHLNLELPEFLVGQPLNATWVFALTQDFNGEIDAFGTGDVLIEVPSGYTFTFEDPTFLSERVPTAVPLPATVALLVFGLCVRRLIGHRRPVHLQHCHRARA